MVLPPHPMFELEARDLSPVSHTADDAEALTEHNACVLVTLHHVLSAFAPTSLLHKHIA